MADTAAPATAPFVKYTSSTADVKKRLGPNAGNFFAFFFFTPGAKRLARFFVCQKGLKIIKKRPFKSP